LEEPAATSSTMTTKAADSSEMFVGIYPAKWHQHVVWYTGITISEESPTTISTSMMGHQVPLKW